MAFLGWSLVAHLGLWALFAARVWSGVATANLGVASAYIADVTAPQDRAKGMGIIGVAFGLGFILGPAIGGALAHVEIRGHAGALPCFVAAAFSLANLAWVLFGLGESLPGEKRTARRRSLSPLDLGAAREAFARPGILLSLIVNFVIILSFTNLDQTFRYFNKDRFGMTAIETGGVLAFIGVVAAAVQGGLIRKLGGKVDEARLIVAGSFIQGVAFAGLSASPLLGRWALYAFGAVLALGNGLTQPSISAFISRRAPASEQGGTLGTNQAVASLARMLGPATGGFLYGHVGPRAPYTVAAVGMVLATFVALLLPPTPRQAE
jgi:MFS family permease